MGVIRMGVHTSASVVNHELQTILRHRCRQRLRNRAKDVKTDFLYDDIDAEVYVEHPEGFGEIGKSDKVCNVLDSRVRPHYFDRFVIEK